MTDFDLFDLANKETQSVDISTRCARDIDKCDLFECKHTNIINENGNCLCVDCGEEISKDILNDKEWTYYGNVDTKHMSDPTRCQVRKLEERTIYKDVKNLGFSEKIINTANKFYSQVTNGKIFRGNSRKAIVFATIFHAFKLSGRPQSCETLINIFKLDRKAALKGLKHVNLNSPKESPIRSTYITPINLIDEIMDKFITTQAQKDEVKKIYQEVKNKSSRLNRSRPQSTSAGIIYYWICLNKKNISMKEYVKKVGLSELTINKIAREISDVLETHVFE